MSLFGFKRLASLHPHPTDPSLFANFNIWALERWKFAPVNGIPSASDCPQSRLIGRDDLKNFLERKGRFVPHRQPAGPDFRGGLRLIFSVKKRVSDNPLSMSLDDFLLIENHLNLHPSTTQYVRRSMKASKFWGADGTDDLNVVLCFPPAPSIRFNSIFLSYNIISKSTNVLIGELGWIQGGINVANFQNMLDNCYDYWEHPLLVPVLALDMLMYTLEGEITKNIASIKEIETEVSQLPSLDKDARPLAERENVTSLLTRLHNTLKYAITLLDAAHWMQQATELLLQTDNELEDKQQKKGFGMPSEWADLKGFLEDMSRLTAHLEPDPVMTQQRCQSQIDILNSKIAQEDNLLAARMAVSATRDSSAMKALAVITALFLPGTYIASLFSMSMFNWQGGDSAASSSSGAIVMPYIWIYWLVSVVLTLVTVVGWRLWWVVEDRAFQRRLPEVVRTTALDEGKVQAHQPALNVLEKSFWEEFWGEDMSRMLRKRVFS